jgi:flagellin-like protein
MRKRGLSPIIASVLLILLVLVLATIIFLWARGFISEQIEKFGNPVEQQCENIDFSVELIGGPAAYSLEVANHGNVPIIYLDVKKTAGGNSEVQSFKSFRLYPNEAYKRGIDIEMEDGSIPEEATIYPVLLGSVRGGKASKAFACVEQGKAITF